jgi:GAF domain-containing protein
VTLHSLDRIAAAAATLLDVPVVVISLVDGDRQDCVGASGITPSEPSALCREVAVSGRPMLYQDARHRVPLVRRGWGLELIAYAGVPLAILEGARAGTIAAFAPIRRAWQSRDLLVLRGFAEAAGAVVDAMGHDDDLRITKRALATALAACASLESRVSETTERERMASNDRRVTQDSHRRSRATT